MNQPVNIHPRQHEPAKQLLKRIDFLKGASDADLEGILSSLMYQQFPKNQVILFQGEIANTLFFVCRGAVHITIKNKGTRIELAELTPPMYFGEISLLTPTSATATATAGEEGANVLMLTHEALETLSTQIPDLKSRIQAVIDARLASKEKAKKDDDDA